MVRKSSASSELLVSAERKLPKPNFLCVLMLSTHQAPARKPVALPDVTSLGFHHDVLPSRAPSRLPRHTARHQCSFKSLPHPQPSFQAFFIKPVSHYTPFHPTRDHLPPSSCTCLVWSNNTTILGTLQSTALQLVCTLWGP
jgi:hypothetical protein